MIFHFASPWWLLLLLVIPVQIWWHLRGEPAQRGVLHFPTTSFLRNVSPTQRVRLRHTTIILQVLGEAVLVVALARPQSGRVEHRVNSEGIDIMIALDVSGSMRALDLGSHERIEVAKSVTRKFIDERKSDRIGMVVFAGRAFTQCPLTTDYGILKKLLNRVSICMDNTIPDGTAIGMAIATAANRLRQSKAKSKVIILLTDGSNNAGIIDPITAAEAAAKVGIRIHTIGVGVEGRAPIRVHDPLFGDRIEFIENSLNEGILKRIASITGGHFFRATSRNALEQIYQNINSMERSKVKTLEIPRYTDLTFTWYLVPIGLLLLLLQFGLAHTVFRTLP